MEVRKRRPGGGRKMTNTFATIEEIMKKKTIFSDDGCWLWQGAKNIKGYGHIRVDGKHLTVSRISAILHLGLREDQTDRHALHRCPNKECWNPEHLYLGDNFDNWADRKEAE